MIDQWHVFRSPAGNTFAQRGRECAVHLRPLDEEHEGCARCTLLARTTSRAAASAVLALDRVPSIPRAR